MSQTGFQQVAAGAASSSRGRLATPPPGHRRRHAPLLLGARNSPAAGHAPDIDIAARHDTQETMPILVAGAFRLTKTTPESA